MSGSNDYTSNLERIDQWLKDASTPAAAVFDIGTRSARVMVGPKKLPGIARWSEETFYTAGFVTALGGDVVANHLAVDDSPSLARLADFIRDTLEVLHGNGVPDENIIAVGTEVFRSLAESNSKEVVDWLKRETGLAIQVISGRTEARLSLFGAFMTYKHGLSQEHWLDEKAGEHLLLIDQGGGSTEISSALSAGRGRVESKADLGTITLRQIFFGGADGERLVDPASNHASIEEQYKRVLTYVQARVDALDLATTGFKIAYGLGTAITACFPGLNTWKVHNKLATADLLSRIEHDTCQSLTAQYPSVSFLYNALEIETDDNRRVRKDKEALLLYGLPVYRMILKKVGSRELRVCGFPLRYGAFIAWHHAGWGFDLKRRAS